MYMYMYIIYILDMYEGDISTIVQVIAVNTVGTVITK